MSRLIANHIANWLVNNGAKEDKQEIYAYGVECLLNTFLTFGVILIASFFMHKTSIALIWFFFFLPLRHTSGGAHASTSLRCFMISISIGIGSMLLNSFISKYIWLILVGIIFSLIIIFSFAPVVHPNHPISQRRVPKVRKAVRTIILIQSCLIILFLLLRINSIAAAAVLGILSASFSTAIGYFINRKYSNNVI